MSRKRIGSRSPFLAGPDNTRRDDLVKEFGFVLAVKARASGVKRLAHEPGRFVVEISPCVNERQD
jgi:hypothetical protein